jgi:tRNA threonylcarbamoyladenosine biosynthesis protein TsaB
LTVQRSPEKREPVLAFDCAGSACSAALVAGAEVLAHRRENRSRGQAERLLPLLEETLAAAGLAWRDVRRLAVTRGPGSFTGVRIGLATARALALASGCPLFALDGFSLYSAMVRERMSVEEQQGRPLLVAIDARRSDLFVQAFDAHGQPLEEACSLLPEAVAEKLAQGRWLLAGDGAAQVEPYLAGMEVELVRECTVADSRTLARWAAKQPLSERPPPPAPLYLRPPDVTLAKVKR